MLEFQPSSPGINSDSSAVSESSADSYSSDMSLPSLRELASSLPTDRILGTEHGQLTKASDDVVVSSISHFGDSYHNVAGVTDGLLD